MKKLLLTLALAFCFLLGFSQTSLTGYITIQNSKGQSAYPVQVKSFGATVPLLQQKVFL